MKQLLKVVRAMEKKMMALVATIQAKGVTNFLTSALLVTFMAGLMIFHAFGDFSVEGSTWNNVYWLWQLSRDVLFWLLILGLTRGFEKVLILVIIYSIVRVCLEILSIIYTVSPNTQVIVDVLFLLMLLVIILLSIKKPGN